MKQKLLFFTAMVLLSGCLSTAKLSDFSQTSSSVDFDKYAKEYKEASTPFWTLKTSNEYYFEKDLSVEENFVFDIVANSFKRLGYKIAFSDADGKCVIGKRGMVANEWSSVTAVYYKYVSNRLQVYIKTKITQDITGGWKENRAKEVGRIIEQQLGSD